MADRIDHFSGMRSEQAPLAEPPEGSPVVTPELIEWLEKAFPHPFPRGAFAADLGAQVEIATRSAIYHGQASVIDHLRQIVRGA